MKRMTTTRNDRMWPPLGFRLWFAFCGALALGIIVTTGVLLFKVGTDPASIGRTLGSISQGYRETAPSP